MDVIEQADITAHEAEVDKLLTVAAGLSGQLGDISHQGGIAQYHVIAAENLKPGVLLDNYPDGGFTIAPSKQNLNIALEEITIAVVAAVVAAIAAIAGLIIKIIQWMSGATSKTNDTVERIKIVKETITKEVVYIVDRDDLLLRNLDFIHDNQHLIRPEELEQFRNKIAFHTGKEYHSSDSIVKILVESRNIVVKKLNNDILEKIPYSFFEMGLNPIHSKYFPVFSALSADMDAILAGIKQAFDHTEAILHKKSGAFAIMAENGDFKFPPEEVAKHMTVTSVINNTYAHMCHALNKHVSPDMTPDELKAGVTEFHAMLQNDSKPGTMKERHDAKPILISKDIQGLVTICENIDANYQRCFTISDAQLTKLQALEKYLENYLKNVKHEKYESASDREVIDGQHMPKDKEWQRRAHQIYRNNMTQIQLALRLLRETIGARAFYIDTVIMHSLVVYRGLLKHYMDYMNDVDSLAAKLKRRVGKKE